MAAVQSLRLSRVASSYRWNLGVRLRPSACLAPVSILDQCEVQLLRIELNGFVVIANDQCYVNDSLLHIRSATLPLPLPISLCEIKGQTPNSLPKFRVCPPISLWPLLSRSSGLLSCGNDIDHHTSCIHGLPVSSLAKPRYTCFHEFHSMGLCLDTS